MNNTIHFLTKLLKILVLSLIFLGISGFLFSLTDTDTQSVTLNVQEVAGLRITPAGGVTLNTIAPVTDGDAVTGGTDITKYLQYTSLIATGLTRKITVEWGVADAAPAGTSLKAVASSIGAGGAGSKGTVAAEVTVSSTAADLVTGIGSCNTGTGATDGANIQFSFSIDTIGSLLVGDSETVTLTFTLTEDA